MSEITIEQVIRDIVTAMCESIDEIHNIELAVQEMTDEYVRGNEHGHSFKAVVDLILSERQAHIQTKKELEELQEKHSNLKSQVIWAINHYGIVNTDGIIQHLKTVMEK